jgi:exodeoxyribonuclease V beta subunit
LADRLESDAAPTAPSSDPLDPTVGDAGAGDEGEPDPDRPETVGGPAEEAAGPGVGRLDALPAGAAFGTLVHAVLERTAFDAVDPPAALAAALGAARRRFPVDLTPPALPGATDDDGRRLLVEGLADCLATPLGAPTTDRPLTAFARADRLDELTFDLRLGATDGRATLAAVGRLLDARLPDDDPVRPWARRVVATAPALPLAGHLTGSIDLVLRVRGDGPDRFVVADYKTNRLVPAGRPAGRDDYGPAALATAMDEHDYPLQAVLYSVALHRYLRWRLHGYDPVVHLGGVAYLFVRGMTGATTTRGGAVPGVWAWRPPADVVTAVSDLLAGVGPGVEAR